MHQLKQYFGKNEVFTQAIYPASKSDQTAERNALPISTSASVAAKGHSCNNLIFPLVSSIFA
jgi:hypothetical protein